MNNDRLNIQKQNILNKIKDIHDNNPQHQDQINIYKNISNKNNYNQSDNSGKEGYYRYKIIGTEEYIFTQIDDKNKTVYYIDKIGSLYYINKNSEHIYIDEYGEQYYLEANGNDSRHYYLDKSPDKNKKYYDPITEDYYYERLDQDGKPVRTYEINPINDKKQYNIQDNFFQKLPNRNYGLSVDARDNNADQEEIQRGKINYNPISEEENNSLFTTRTISTRQTTEAGNFAIFYKRVGQNEVILSVPLINEGNKVICDFKNAVSYGNYHLLKNEFIILALKDNIKQGTMAEDQLNQITLFEDNNCKKPPQKNQYDAPKLTLNLSVLSDKKKIGDQNPNEPLTIKQEIERYIPITSFAFKKENLQNPEKLKNFASYLTLMKEEFVYDFFDSYYAMLNSNYKKDIEEVLLTKEERAEYNKIAGEKNEEINGTKAEIEKKKKEIKEKIKREQLEFKIATYVRKNSNTTIPEVKVKFLNTIEQTIQGNLSNCDLISASPKEIYLHFMKSIQGTAKNLPRYDQNKNNIGLQFNGFNSEILGELEFNQMPVRTSTINSSINKSIGIPPPPPPKINHVPPHNNNQNKSGLRDGAINLILRYIELNHNKTNFKTSYMQSLAIKGLIEIANNSNTDINGNFLESAILNSRKKIDALFQDNNTTKVNDNIFNIINNTKSYIDSDRTDLDQAEAKAELDILTDYLKAKRNVLLLQEEVKNLEANNQTLEEENKKLLKYISDNQGALQVIARANLKFLNIHPFDKALKDEIDRLYKLNDTNPNELYRIINTLYDNNKPTNSLILALPHNQQNIIDGDSVAWKEYDAFVKDLRGRCSLSENQGALQVIARANLGYKDIDPVDQKLLNEISRLYKMNNDNPEGLYAIINTFYNNNNDNNYTFKNNLIDALPHDKNKVNINSIAWLEYDAFQKDLVERCRLNSLVNKQKNDKDSFDQFIKNITNIYNQANPNQKKPELDFKDNTQGPILIRELINTPPNNYDNILQNLNKDNNSPNNQIFLDLYCNLEESRIEANTTSLNYFAFACYQLYNNNNSVVFLDALKALVNPNVIDNNTDKSDYYSYLLQALRNKDLEQDNLKNFANKIGIVNLNYIINMLDTDLSNNNLLSTTAKNKIAESITFAKMVLGYTEEIIDLQNKLQQAQQAQQALQNQHPKNTETPLFIISKVLNNIQDLKSVLPRLQKNYSINDIYNIFSNGLKPKELVDISECILKNYHLMYEDIKNDNIDSTARTEALTILEFFSNFASKYNMQQQKIDDLENQLKNLNLPIIEYIFNNLNPKIPESLNDLRNDPIILIKYLEKIKLLKDKPNLPQNIKEDLDTIEKLLTKIKAQQDEINKKNKPIIEYIFSEIFQNGTDPEGNDLNKIIKDPKILIRYRNRIINLKNSLPQNDKNRKDIKTIIKFLDELEKKNQTISLGPDHLYMQNFFTEAGNNIHPLSYNLNQRDKYNKAVLSNELIEADNILNNQIKETNDTFLKEDEKITSGICLNIVIDPKNPGKSIIHTTMLGKSEDNQNNFFDITFDKEIWRFFPARGDLVNGHPKGEFHTILMQDDGTKIDHGNLPDLLDVEAAFSNIEMTIQNINPLANLSNEYNNNKISHQDNLHNESINQNGNGGMHL